MIKNNQYDYPFQLFILSNIIIFLLSLKFIDSIKQPVKNVSCYQISFSEDYWKENIQDINQSTIFGIIGYLLQISSIMQKDLAAKAVNIFTKINYAKTEWPLIIAHRGYSSIFPQNTEESIEAALYKSHLVQFDVMLSKDNEIVIFHDRGLSLLTNVEKIPEFSHKKEEKQYDQKDGKLDLRADWWVNQFTMKQLQKLRVRQAYKQRPQLQSLSFKIQTLQYVLRRHITLKSTMPTSNVSGYLIQLKSLYDLKDDERDKQLVRQLVKLLKKLNLSDSDACATLRFPIVLQSFNQTILQELEKSELVLPLVHLYDYKTDINAQFLEKHMLSKSIGIGISEEHANQEIKNLCEDRGLLMFYWTVIDDRPEKLPFGLNDYSLVYDKLFTLGIEGIITEFPEKCHEYIALFNLKKGLTQP